MDDYPTDASLTLVEGFSSMWRRANWIKGNLWADWYVTNEPELSRLRMEHRRG